ncbi:MAG: hypothetical protein JNL73_04990, partial [Anaerolineales bacterium]|nr:hypothetical protein [Anaerolineales bacterium]
AGISKHISFEMCRWTFALRHAQSGTDDDLIRRYLGLSRIQWREIGMKLKRLVDSLTDDDIQDDDGASAALPDTATPLSFDLDLAR